MILLIFLTMPWLQPIAEGVGQYKTALKAFFASQEKDVLFFERNFRSDHMQLQVW